MPINIPDGLPAKTILQQERIFALEEEVASHQEIRPLRVAILNLMPTKIETETQILRLISKSPLQVSCDFMRVSTHESTHVSQDHLVKFYDTFDAFRDKNYDGLIITGAPARVLHDVFVLGRAGCAVAPLRHSQAPARRQALWRVQAAPL